MTRLEFIDKSNKVHNHMYDYSMVDYRNNKTKIIIICKEHGQYEQRPDSHLRGLRCYKCRSSQTKLSLEQVVLRTNNANYNFSESIYTNIDSTISVYCELHDEYFKVIAKNLFKGWGCRLCSGKSQNINIFKEKANIIHNNKYNYNISDYINNRTKINIICELHGVFTQLPGNHLKGLGCPKCATHKRTTTQSDFIERANRIHNYKYEYYHISETYGNGNSKLKIVCKKHGDFIQSGHSHLSGRGCPICKESKGEQIISSILCKFYIKHERFKSFETCKFKNKLIFDFWLPDNNILIEFDGIQHQIAIEFFGGEERLHRQLLNDGIKNKWCIDNNIKLLRISDVKLIESVIMKHIIKC